MCVYFLVYSMHKSRKSQRQSHLPWQKNIMIWRPRKRKAMLRPHTCKYWFGALPVTSSDLCALYLQTKVYVRAKSIKSRNAPPNGFQSSTCEYPPIDPYRQMCDEHPLDVSWLTPEFPFMASLWIRSGEWLAIKGFRCVSSDPSSGGSFRSSQ